MIVGLEILPFIDESVRHEGAFWSFLSWLTYDGRTSDVRLWKEDLSRYGEIPTLETAIKKAATSIGLPADSVWEQVKDAAIGYLEKESGVKVKG